MTKRWNENKDPSMGQQLKNAIRPPGPIKPRLDAAVRRINTQSMTLNRSSDRFEQRYKKLFDDLVNAYERHDMVRARILANELAEIRKMQKMTLEANFAMEQIAMRLQTVTELGDITTSLAPIVEVVRNMKTMMRSISPSASNGIGEIGDLLTSISLDAGSISSTTINFDSTTTDSQKILTEAATLAEQRMKTKFPDLQQIDETTGQRIVP